MQFRQDEPNTLKKDYQQGKIIPNEACGLFNF